MKAVPGGDTQTNRKVTFPMLLSHDLCFASRRLSQLSRAERLTHVVRCDLFPSADMIRGLSENCGTNAGQREKRGGANAAADTPTRPVAASTVRVKSNAPLSAQTSEYAKWKDNSRSVHQSRDFIQVGGPE